MTCPQCFVKTRRHEGKAGNEHVFLPDHRIDVFKPFIIDPARPE